MNKLLSFLKFFKKDIGEKKVQKLVVGLGNFGKIYEKTRHNAGFEAVDFLASKIGTSFSKEKFNSLCASGQISDFKCLLLKPLTFMNNSGIAVEAAMKFYRLDVQDIFVLVDDVSFEPGKIRIKRSGSAGGHNGLKSIIHEIGSDNFVRIKIGVGKKPRPDFDLANWVISKFDSESFKKMEKACFDVSVAIELILNGKIENAMNKFN